jgi:tRNA-dihydrouridine synthase
MNPLPSPPPLRPIQVGPVTVDCPVILAPMTGVTDLPFRKLVRSFGSGLNVTEMIASPAAIRETRQSVQKAMWDPREEPVSMQLVGCEPAQMGDAARLVEDRGAAIIDINMGCPVRKVVNGDAGSALMRDVPLAARLIEATVKAVSVPVTVKMRMGWCHDSLNAPELARQGGRVDPGRGQRRYLHHRRCRQGARTVGCRRGDDRARRLWPAVDPLAGHAVVAQRHRHARSGGGRAVADDPQPLSGNA